MRASGDRQYRRRELDRPGRQFRPPMQASFYSILQIAQVTLGRCTMMFPGDYPIFDDIVRVGAGRVTLMQV
ncbi:hypothetical protein MesoLjLc_45560 [Mesorhizobium sp. L-8-10]|uniref:hypothetical protein n=1 Tax=Mesorhizobium sp. L-8-10 TaxID=2744523 RepID=UPI0019382CE5|nr:hypothetical protein [Mesorhizobium sp. L-8-10]BCH32626.1 hypothetical protein MesoLjLc_45560 [Mesorhizobium sp. L-8-10]